MLSKVIGLQFLTHKGFFDFFGTNFNMPLRCECDMELIFKACCSEDNNKVLILGQDKFRYIGDGIMDIALVIAQADDNDEEANLLMLDI